MSERQFRILDMRVDVDELIRDCRDGHKPDETLLELIEAADAIYEQACIKGAMSNEDVARYRRQIGAFFHSDAFEQILKANLMREAKLQDALAIMCSMSFRCGIRTTALAQARGVKLWSGISTDEAKTS